MKNKYQSWWEWIYGRWECPNCRTLWQGMSVCSDMSLATMDKKKVVERRLECPRCGFIEVIT